MPHNRKSVWLRMLLAAVPLALIITVVKAEQSGPTEAIRACMGQAVADELQCHDDLPWYAEPLCGLRFNSDIVLCALLGGLG